MPIINIDTDDLPERYRTAKGLRNLADWHENEGDHDTVSILRHLSDAMPVPLPTTPGSQVRCDGEEWTLLRASRRWYCHTSVRGLRASDALAALGPVEVIRDAGVA